MPEERPDASARPPSLCASCSFVRHVQGRRGQAYLLCRNPQIGVKYPAQPVVRCSGFRDTASARGRLDAGG